MILQALCQYYDRKTAEDGASLPPPGLAFKELAFVIVLDDQGRFLRIDDTREGDGKNRRGKRQLVPQPVKRTVNVAANLLWDNLEYTLGYSQDLDPRELRKVELRHLAFLQRLRDLAVAVPGDVEISALQNFLSSNPVAALEQDSLWKEVSAANPFVAFRVHGQRRLICQSPAVTRCVADRRSGGTGPICLVSGTRGPVATLHPSIQGVRGASTTGANIVSFNLRASESFGRQQGANAPTSSEAASAYTAALNRLLGRDSRQRIQVGDATTVFWAEKQSGDAATTAFADWFDPPKDNPDAGTASVKALYEFGRGKPLTDEDDQRFYVLGLAPNRARLAIRFWHVATIRTLGERIFRYFEDIDITLPPRERGRPSLYRLMSSLAALGKMENLPPRLGGDLMRAILEGLPLPVAALQAAIRRCRAERDAGPLRSALIKAALNRAAVRKEEKLEVSLDSSNENAGYRLGRLFATLEKIQEESSPGLNATIRDRYFSAASSTPLTVFPILNRLKNHHLAKLENWGRRVFFERLIGEVVAGLDASSPFPAALSLQDQGRFMVGYYHQRQKFFEKTGGAN